MPKLDKKTIITALLVVVGFMFLYNKNIAGIKTRLGGA